MVGPDPGMLPRYRHAGALHLGSRTSYAVCGLTWYAIPGHATYLDVQWQEPPTIPIGVAYRYALGIRYAGMLTWYAYQVSMPVARRARVGMRWHTRTSPRAVATLPGHAAAGRVLIDARPRCRNWH